MYDELSEADIQKMKEVGELSKKYGEFLARNIVDIKYAVKDRGIYGVAKIVKDKVKRKMR